ncbi:MAG: hypothetical protein EOO07_15335 [Chitinophagaceae bacterium]|nr:MAG: hypothetical protein EOO07_15335 [Chitinophagaceae bacterium]
MRKLYDLFLESTAMSWSDYFKEYKSCGRKVQSIFQNEIYSLISLELFVVTLMSLAFYYLYLNNRFGRYYSNKTWFSFLFLNGLLIGVITYLSAKSALADVSCSVGGQLGWISVINFLLALILFTLLSFVFRLGSAMGKHTPYFTTN